MCGISAVLTMLWQGGRMRALLLLMLCLTAACSDGPEEGVAAPGSGLIDSDPVIARALHDPLMSDPDLASRNEANAALGAPDSHALPVLPSTSADASAAREAMRLELLATGPIPDLPLPPGEEEDEDEEEAKPAPPIFQPMGPMAPPADLLAALGLPASCAARLNEDFALAASLPAAAALPPQGMVIQAGGSEAAGCRLRIIRYVSAAPLIDVLHYHYARATRAGLTGRRQAVPADMIIAQGKGAERLVVEARRAAHGMTGVTLLYRVP
jgi:hypothetical protein